MEIRTARAEDALILQLIGRFDANWSQHVGNSIEDAIRAGNHIIEVDVSEVAYISSAGLSVLVTYYGKLKKANGSLRVLNAKDHVQSVLKMTGLASILVTESASSRTEKEAFEQTKRVNIDGCEFEFHTLSKEAFFECEFIGTPSRLHQGNLHTNEAVVIEVDSDAFCLGIGAFEQNTDVAIQRFGESLGISGIAVVQPTDESDVPDFVVAQGEMTAELSLLYGIAGRGSHSNFIRFDAGESQEESVALSKLILVGLDELKCEAAAFVVIAESTNVVGASLIQSPTLAKGQNLLSFPEIREWLSFTIEPDHDRHLVLIVGVVSREANAPYSSFLRPIGGDESTQGHFHGCVFPYHPVPKGKIELATLIHGLFEKAIPKTVLHLINDDRAYEGVGETQLMRGACWYGPLSVSKSTI